jgi:hypothetical protein
MHLRFSASSSSSCTHFFFPSNTETPLLYLLEEHLSRTLALPLLSNSEQETKVGPLSQRIPPRRIKNIFGEKHSSMLFNIGFLVGKHYFWEREAR